MRGSIAITAALAVALAGAVPASGLTHATESGAKSYLVLFDQGTSTAVGVAAVEAAGGEVVSVNTDVGLAVVKSANDQFVTDVAAADGVFGAATNQVIGTTGLGKRKFDDERLQPERDASRGTQAAAPAAARVFEEPLASLQWDMAMIDADAEGSYDEQRGKKQVVVGIIDTGIDGRHPDIARNFDWRLSRNFTVDIPEVDGACEDEADGSCEDKASVDENGHGTHVAGIVAAPINRLGIAGVAPGVTLVNLRAGQDSGFFFLPAVVDALTYAGRIGVDVVNMSFYTDPWLYNCPSAADQIPAPSDEELLEQQMIIEAHFRALQFAHDRGVTLIGSLGNSHIDLGAATKFDNTSPDFPLGTEYERTVTNNCIDLPVEGPHVIGVSALGPSTIKADYSNYGVEQITVSAPGGYFRDGLGTPTFQTPGNLVLSAYPEAVGRESGDIDDNGEPTNPFVLKNCRKQVCAYYQYLQGTSMAAPHAVGVAALIVSEHGRYGRGGTSFGLSPDEVERILTESATETACPTPNPYSYEPVGRDPSYTAFCEGDVAFNGFHGYGIINALEAVR